MVVGPYVLIFIRDNFSLVNVTCHQVSVPSVLCETLHGRVWKVAVNFPKVLLADLQRAS